MNSQRASRRDDRDPELFGQTVVLIGASAGIALDTARLARTAGADVIVRGPERLRSASNERTAVAASAGDGGDTADVERLLDALPRPIDHVVVFGGGAYQSPLTDFDFTRAQRDIDEQLWLPMRVARAAVGRVRPGGTLLFVGGPSDHRKGRSLVEALTAARPALIANLALEVAPIRINLIGGGIVDRPLSARLLGEALHQGRNGVCESMPIARIVRPADVAALAVHIMYNTSLTGTTYDLDGPSRCA